ncbi:MULTISPECIES: hypothetical protein [unclassified Streptomyces]|uniref:hypothetical protein n=1 Tax=unclassified Streptomyces TaxID=2593676 RepID=UPI001F106EEF|nr:MULTISPECIES: hypothetical protein [unclassified Streptomyces]
MRAGVRRRLLSLAIGELVNVPLQTAVWFGVAGVPTTAANLLGFGLVVLLLLEGTAYWTVKLRALSAEPGAPLPGAAWFAAARVVNVVLLGLGVPLTALMVAVDPGTGSVPGLLFALFAVLEHVNYFHTQLMYSTPEDRRSRRVNGRRRAHLARDLERARQGSSQGAAFRSS